MGTPTQHITWYFTQQKMSFVCISLIKSGNMKQRNFGHFLNNLVVYNVAVERKTCLSSVTCMLHNKCVSSL